MIPEKHNKVIGFLLIGHALFNALMVIVLVQFIRVASHILGEIMVSLFTLGTKHMEGAPTFWEVLTAFDWKFQAGFSILFLIQLISGLCVLLKVKYARIAGIIGAITAMIASPVGLLIGIFALIFFFGRKGQQFYKETDNESITEELI